MTDRNNVADAVVRIAVSHLPHLGIGPGRAFTKSNGTIVARIYERLTRASRRRASDWFEDSILYDIEQAYRFGVYDALKALQDELV